VDGKKVAFLTGTRADFGKLKSLIRTLNDDNRFEVHLFVTGMHMEPKYGYTVEEVKKCGFPNIYPFINQASQGRMDTSLGHTILGFGDYVRLVKPDLIVVHGDRSEALAGAMVGALHNIPVAHIEGGEVSGTIDEHIRHAVSKLAPLHFVCNDDAKRRLLQLGESPESIHIIGSPDVDIMNSPNLPTLSQVKAHYDIPFKDYGVMVLHPVTTSTDSLRRETLALVNAAKESGKNFVVIYPNSDSGSETILNVYDEKLSGQKWARVFPSIRFECMLVLLKNASLIIGNSSMGIREAPYYGVPTINLGSRQNGRSQNPDLLNISFGKQSILKAIEKTTHLRLTPVQEWGDGKSHLHFRDVLLRPEIWRGNIQKVFRDIPVPPENEEAA